MTETQVQEVVGLNPNTLYLMDMTFFHIDLLLALYCLFEKTKNKRKRDRGWSIFKLKILESGQVQKSILFPDPSPHLEHDKRVWRQLLFVLHPIVHLCHHCRHPSHLPHAAQLAHLGKA